MASSAQPRRYANGGPLKRHVKPKGNKRPPDLAADHPAIVEGRSLFPSTVVHASMSPRVLVSGHNSRKIGKMVVKGRWKGMPIFTLTLEERSHCPATCQEWRTCYGNNMNWARRHIGGAALEAKLASEMDVLQARYPAGFVVRLHVLGDFYSLPYVQFWQAAFERWPALRVFGFTAQDFDSEIGNAVLAMTLNNPSRCRIRFSGTDADGLGALVIDDASASKHLICPMQRDLTDCCGTCGLCWTMGRTIEFLRH